jgi:hypothetical protein
MLGNTQNPLLMKTEQETAAKVLPKFKNSFERIIAAGLKFMYSKETHDEMVGILNAKRPPEINVGDGVGKLMGILWNEGKGTLPMQAYMPAAAVLLCEGMDFAEKAGKIQVTPQTLAAATKECYAIVLRQFGVTPEKMQQMLAQQGKGGQGMPSMAPAPGAPPQTPPATGKPAGIIASAMGG